MTSAVRKNTAIAAVLAVLFALVDTLAPRWLAPVRDAAYDLGVAIAPRNPAAVENYVVVAIDDDAVARLGPWPWPRGRLAELVSRLNTAEPHSIALDLPLDQATGREGVERLAQLEALLRKNRRNLGRKQLRELQRQIREARRDLDQDAALEAALKKVRRLYLAMYFNFAGNGGRGDLPEIITRRAALPVETAGAPLAPPAYQPVRYPLARFAQHAEGIGHASFATMANPVQRHLPLLLRSGEDYIPGLALWLATDGAGHREARITDGRLQLGERAFPVDPQGRLWPGFYLDEKGGPAFTHLSAAKILNGETAPAAIRGKRLIVSLTANDYSDYYRVPGALPFSRADLIANLATAMDNGDLFARPDWADMAHWLSLAAVFLIMILVYPRFSATVSVLFTALVAGGLVVASLFLLMKPHLWVDLVTPALFLLLGHLLLGTVFFATRRQGRLHEELAESNRMLAVALQSQGQLDQAMDRLRHTTVIDNGALEVAYSLAQDFESKRQFGKAMDVYDYILQHDAGFRDAAERKERISKVDEAAVVRTSGSLIMEGVDSKPKLGRYEVEKEIGRGAMGTVYLGHDPKINRTVAIKTLSLADSFGGMDIQDVTRRFFREAETAGKLNHPNIVTVHDAGQEHDLIWMAMEYLDGKDLTHYVNRKKKAKLDWVLEVIWQAAGALDYAHGEGIVHRDIKPANIMYLPEDDSIKITDFGIARLMDASTTKTGTALGTPCYMSPEQISGKKVDGRSDFFSLGVTMYELLTGQLPFDGDSLPALVFQITSKRQKSILQLRKNLPTCVKTIVDKLLQKDPKDRYPDGAALQAAIERCQKK